MIVTMQGYVYFLINKAMPGLLKIGHTTISVSERLAQLNSTGVPIPFEIGACFFVYEPQECESKIHKCLNSYRVSKNREFFNVALNEALKKSSFLISKYLFKSYDSDRTAHIERNLDLSDIEISILKHLADDYHRKYGFLTWQIQDDFREADALDIEYYLACLKGHGFIEEKTKKGHHDKNWKINSNGIKYLYDSGVFITKPELEEFRGHDT